MELVDARGGDLGVTRKRKRYDGENNMLSNFSLDDLNQDILERVLSRLPTSAFFRLSSVCKRWKSVAASSSFKSACSDISARDPWFFMVDPHLNRSIVFDSTEKNWKKLNYPNLLQNHHLDSMPVAASGGLICFRNSLGNFVVSNPLTGSCSELPPVDLDQKDQSLHAIVMSADPDGCKGSYKLVLVYGQVPKLRFKVYSSTTGCWDEDVALSRKVDDSIDFNFNDDTVVYFLSRTGNVVSTNMQRSPSKQYSSVVTNKNGEDTVYFISSSGTIMACNLSKRCFVEYPRLLFLHKGINIISPYKGEHTQIVSLVKGMCSFNKWQAFIASLTIKYVTLHKIGISNWIPSTHASTLYTYLGHFIYLVGNGDRVNVGDFVFLIIY